MIMNEKNLAILARLRAQMIEEAQKEESMHIHQKNASNSSQASNAHRKSNTGISNKSSSSHKKKQKKKPEVYPKLTISLSFIDGGQSSKFREQNRRMVEKQSNIGRNHSNFNESLHAYHGGTVTPK